MRRAPYDREHKQMPWGKLRPLHISGFSAAAFERSPRMLNMPPESHRQTRPPDAATLTSTTAAPEVPMVTRDAQTNLHATSSALSMRARKKRTNALHIIVPCLRAKVRCLQAQSNLRGEGHPANEATNRAATLPTQPRPTKPCRQERLARPHHPLIGRMAAPRIQCILKKHCVSTQKHVPDLIIKQ